MNNLPLVNDVPNNHSSVNVATNNLPLVNFPTNNLPLNNVATNNDSSVHPATNDYTYDDLWLGIMTSPNTDDCEMSSTSSEDDTDTEKLDNTDVLYSLLDVDNQRLNTLVHDKSFTNTINFVLTTITDDVLSIADSILDHFCISILPKIDYNIKSLVLESESMERILLSADYPNLTELTL
ncbi:unnamed protein product, partial [Rotaria magnacalcarata]